LLPYRHLPMVVLVAFSGVALAQPVLPGPESNAPRPDTSSVPDMSCGKVYSPNWDNCVGLVAYPNGNIYRGEFHHGTRQGFGFIVINAKGVSDSNNILSKEESIYAGEFRGNKLNGHGVWFTNSGAGYSGTFVENIPQSDVSQRNCTGELSSWSNCVASVRYGNGNLYRGEFVNGHREGIGMIEIQATGMPDGTSIRTPVPGVYVGEFKGDRLNGRGMIFMPDAGYYGTFKDNLFISSSVTLQLTVPSVPARTATSVYPRIAFFGQQYTLYQTEHISNGWAAHYSIDPEHPDSATDTIVINRLHSQDTHGREIGPADYAHEMLDGVKSRGATVILPFAVPDNRHPNQYTYYADFYYIYPEQGLGDIWLSRIFLDDSGIVSILYRRTISGYDRATLERAVRQWIAMNVTSRGTALGSLTLPAQPSELPGPSP